MQTDPTTTEGMGLSTLFKLAREDPKYLLYQLAVYGEMAAVLPSRILTSPVRMLPDFLIIGTAKGGTSSLYFHLNKHPCVAAPFRKEIYFFDRTFGRGVAWYRSFFPTLLKKHLTTRRLGTPLVTGESTPCYMFHPHVPRRVFETIPHVKLIVLLRNPIDRAYSYYNQQLRRGAEQLSFEQAIDREEQRLQGELDRMLADEGYFSFKRQNFSYVTRGLYAEQLERWLSYFQRQQLLILESEELFSNPARQVQRVLAFLDLPQRDLRVFPKINHVPYRQMKPATRQRLRDHFRLPNQKLYDLIGKDFGWQ
jgi:hypothetical protein